MRAFCTSLARVTLDVSRRVRDTANMANLKAIRADKNLTQEQLAHRCDVSTRTVAAIEAGRRTKQRTRERIERGLKAFNVAIDWPVTA